MHHSLSAHVTRAARGMEGRAHPGRCRWGKPITLHVTPASHPEAATCAAVYMQQRNRAGWISTPGITTVLKVSLCVFSRPSTQQKPQWACLPERQAAKRQSAGVARCSSPKEDGRVEAVKRQPQKVRATTPTKPLFRVRGRCRCTHSEPCT